MEAGKRQAGGMLQAGWREEIGRLEIGWRQAGDRMEAGLGGNIEDEGSREAGLEADSEKDGSGTETGVEARRRQAGGRQGAGRK
jgi:hypothetical protein